jgi:aspartyl-tRNA(Asn)/glutamyl-tRNA(Gln) amidotransferase subunit A
MFDRDSSDIAVYSPFIPNSAFNNSYLKALQLRHNLRKDYQAVFRSPHPLTSDAATLMERGVDVILHPTAIQTAPLLPPVDNTLSRPPSALKTGTSEYAQDILTVPASLAGLPAVSVPYGVGKADGWPVGVSLTGQWGMEALMLDITRVGVESYYEAGQAARRHMREEKAGAE